MAEYSTRHGTVTVTCPEETGINAVKVGPDKWFEFDPKTYSVRVTLRKPVAFVKKGKKPELYFRKEFFFPNMADCEIDALKEVRIDMKLGNSIYHKRFLKVVESALRKLQNLEYSS